MMACAPSLGDARFEERVKRFRPCLLGKLPVASTCHERSFSPSPSSSSPPWFLCRAERLWPSVSASWLPLVVPPSWLVLIEVCLARGGICFRGRVVTLLPVAHRLVVVQEAVEKVAVVLDRLP